MHISLTQNKGVLKMIIDTIDQEIIVRDFNIKIYYTYDYFYDEYETTAYAVVKELDTEKLIVAYKYSFLEEEWVVDEEAEEEVYEEYAHLPMLEIVEKFCIVPKNY